MPRFVFLVLVASGWLAAQSHPNFSGTWKLNLADSDYSDKRANVPDRLVLTIQHKDKHLKFRMERQKAEQKGGFEAEVTIGGSPYESDEAGIITVEWKADALLVRTLYNPGSDRQSDQVETWTLSSDGKKMIDELIVHPPRNAAEVHIKRVFDRQ